MSKEKQMIEEMAKIIAVKRGYGCNEQDHCDMSCQVYKVNCVPYEDAEIAYNAGYRKQREGVWGEDGRCTVCGWYMPFDCNGDAFESLYCPHCGADMKRKEYRENEKDT